MVWITPKTNWSKDDYYNAEDLNRVENNTKVVADMLGVQTTNIITNRDYSSLLFSETLNRIESSIEALNVINMEWQKMKTTWVEGEPFSYKDANRLEVNIANLYSILSRNLRSQKYCGNTICGGGYL
ncbi:MAG: hypothetical protein RR891_06005 [Clostridium sp.]